MRRNFTNLIKKLNLKHRSLLLQHKDRRLQWKTLVRKAEVIYNQAIKDAESIGFWENIFIQKSPDKLENIFEGEKYLNFNMIAFCIGTHPTDISVETYREGKKVGRRIISEKGGAFVISQMPNGGVSFNLYPSSSEVHNMDREPVMIRVFKKPCDVAERHIYRAVRNFLKYSQDTSYTRFYPLPKFLIEQLKKYSKEIIYLFIGALLSFFVATLLSNISKYLGS